MWYKPVSRSVVHITNNKVWLTTVEQVKHKDRDGNISDDISVRIRKWRARTLEKENKDKDIKVWRESNGINLKDTAITDEVFSAVYDYLTSTRNEESVKLNEEEYEQLKEQEQKAEQLEDKVQNLKKIKESAQEELKAYKKRIDLMKDNKREYRDQLESMRELIEDEETTETEIHELFTRKNLYWIFGLEYVDLESEKKFPPGEGDYRFDIMLSRHDNFYDLVELKGPNENLFDQRTKHRTKPNAKLAEAVGQVFTYLRACEEQNLDDIFKPRARVVIGKEQTDDIKERRLFSSYLNNVEVLTYSDLYEMGEKVLEHLEEI